MKFQYCAPGRNANLHIFHRRMVGQANVEFTKTHISPPFDSHPGLARRVLFAMHTKISTPTNACPFCDLVHLEIFL
jgi:hypothetical protein